MRHDVAIYTTSAEGPGFYERGHARAGGAERQMTLLADALARRGLRVAPVVYPPRDPVELAPTLTLVPRAPYAGGHGVVGDVREATRIWRALRAADARVVVVRTGSPVLAVAAAYCTLHRRRLIFSSAHAFDFTFQPMPGRVDRSLYRAGVRRADALVVQSGEQAAAAARAFPSARRVVHIPSFAEPAAPPPSGDREPPDAFLWFARAVYYKQPLRYLDLAKALPEARFRMIPVASRPDAAELEALRSAATAVPNVELLDPLPHAELATLIERSVAVVNTSTHEGVPNAFLEAWARGVPVLTLSVDPDDVVARHGLGVAAGGSWERFVAGARDLWGSRGDRAELAGRTRAYVGATHGVESVAARWADLIAEVGRGGRR